METVKERLDELEREILARIKALREQLAPLEAELGNVSRARAALEPRTVYASAALHGRGSLIAQGSALTAVAYGTAEAHNVSAISGPIDWSDAYKDLTMKELVIQALAEQFRNGATAHQLLDFFVHAWNRPDIKRSSLSPQLSRLKTEGKIARKGLVWRLADAEIAENETPADDLLTGVSEAAGEGTPEKELSGT